MVGKVIDVDHNKYPAYGRALGDTPYDLRDRAPLTFTGIVRRLKAHSIQLTTMEGDAVSSEFSQKEPMAGRIEGFREAQID